MNVLSNLEPNNVFHFFGDICNIPHGSGNTKGISDYLVAFAKQRNLFYVQDEINNIIIVKDATEGYENIAPVIIQGHMDMVAVKKDSCNIDMEKDPLRLQVDGDDIYAEGTSLGGDDGIAVAYALALLDSHEISHPRLEVVITVDEETGMDGARSIDLSILQGKQLLNIDSEEEGFLLTSCAGGCRVTTYLPVNRVQKEGTIYQVKIVGLQGGHSGVEIHTGRGNASHLLARALYHVYTKVPFSLVQLEGGTKDNAIPREAIASVMLEKEHVDLFEAAFKEVGDKICHELTVKDKNAEFICKKVESTKETVLSQEETLKALTFVFLQPDGVQSMSADIDGLVETSLNLGIMELEDSKLVLHFSIRSALQSAKECLVYKVSLTATSLGGTYEVFGDYPAWEYKQDSPLREKMISVYKKMYGKDLVLQAIHAGLECGLLSEKIPGLDCVSFGPNMQNIHTTEEKLSISSTKRVWEYILEVLKTK